MRRSTTKYVLSAGLIALASLALVPSCVNNDSSMFVVGVIDIDAASCMAKADVTEEMRPAGVLDTQFSQSYTAFLLVGNQLTEQGAREQLRTETSRISLRGAEVTLTTLDGKAIAGGHYSTVGTGFVDPASGDAPSYAAVPVNIIPSGLTNLPSVVLAKIRVFGNTLGGTSITSSELDFPITVCDGCLVEYSAADADMTLAKDAPYLCSKAASSTTTSTVAPPCLMGQDQSFSCTLCAGSVPLCRDPTLNPSYTKTP